MEINKDALPKKCSKCGGELVKGYILDTDAPGGAMMNFSPMFFTQGRWVAGEPEPSSFSGIKWDNREAYKIRAWRCPKCGFIELYATDPTKYPDTP
jgi:hypothetical protein